MRFKRLLALLLAAALALAVLVGCGSGQQSAAQALLALLDGKYPNISIEIDPDLEADLRQAISQAEVENAGDDAAAIRAALEKLVGSTVTFRNLGDGQQGDTTFDLVFYAGTDPDKAAQAAYSQWNIVFANVPDDGKYGTGLAMVETENGIWMLVKATVEKAGTEDKAEPATVTGISVSSQPKKTQYNKGEPFDPDGMVVTVHYSDGSTKKIENITSNGNQGVTWSPANIENNPTTVTITYGGKTDTVAVKLITLTEIKVTHSPTKTEYTVGDSFNPDGMVVTAYYSDDSSDTITSDKYTVKINDSPVSSSFSFATAGDYTLTVTYDNLTSDPVNIHVTDQNGYHEDSSGNYVVTGIDGLQNLYSNNQSNFTTAKITLNSPVTLGQEWPVNITFSGTLNGNGNKITMEGDRTQGLFNEISWGTVENVHLQIDGTIENSSSNVGAVAGLNYGTIQNCDVTISNGGKIDGGVYSAGGVVGWNYKTISDCTVTITGTISGTGLVGGVAGYNEGSEAIIKNCRVESGTIQGSSSGAGAAGGIVGDNSGTIQGCSSAAAVQYGANTGGIAGINTGGSITACYSTGTVTGIQNTGYNGTGGVVGQNGYGGTVTACYHATGTVQRNSSRTGGVVGYNANDTDNSVYACYWSSTDEYLHGIGGGNVNADGGTAYGADAGHRVPNNISWTDATTAMNGACSGQYKDRGENTPPKLTWE